MSTPSRRRAPPLDIVGQRFGRLLVTARAGSLPSRQATWACLCIDCGTTHVARSQTIRKGRISSCHCPKELTTERLRELLHYDPETGVFSWRVSRCGGMAKVGGVAGYIAGDYLRITLDGQSFAASRLAWLYMSREWPTNDIDHQDTNPLNNRWLNLRDATEHMNLQNQLRAHRNNKSGFLGVSAFHKRWQSRIRIDGKDRHLGTFDTAEAAHAAYVAAKRAHHPGCTL